MAPGPEPIRDGRHRIKTALQQFHLDLSAKTGV
jgi:hypothetical protein